MKHYLITGASKGIGKAIARRLIEEGAQVTGLARTFDWEDPCLTQVCYDLSKTQALPEFFSTLAKQIKNLDGVVCAAGKGRFGFFEEFSYPQIQELMALNFLSQVYLIRAFLPLFKRQKRGEIVVIGSEAALAGKKQGAIYCASKFALRGFCQALREECASSGVRVCLINPGMVLTDFFEHLSFECGKEPNQHIIPEDIASLVSLVLEARPGTVFDEINLSPQSHYVKFKKIIND